MKNKATPIVVMRLDGLKHWAVWRGNRHLCTYSDASAALSRFKLAMKEGR